MGEKEEEQIKGSNSIRAKVKGKILMTIVGVIIAIYILYTIYLLVINPTNIFTVEIGTLYQEETTIGYVIREEVIVQGDNYKNGITPIKSEGEKVAKGDEVFRYNTQNEEILEEKIAELDIEIEEVINKNELIYPTEVKLIEDEIDTLVNKLNYETDTIKLKQYKSDIDELVLEKAKISGSLSPQGSYLNQLIEERKKYESELNSGSEYVTAPISGVVSYKIDGYEDVLTPSSFSELTIEYLEDLDLKTGKSVSSSEEKGKVINNFECYIVTSSDSKEALESELGDKLQIRLSNGEIVDGEIVYITNADETCITIKIQDGTEYLIDSRKITVDLIWWDDTGLKIPNKAILEKDGLSYVVRERQGYLDEMLIKVERVGEKYSIVEPYSTDELKELGYTPTEIYNYKKITIYDEILLDANTYQEE